MADSTTFRLGDGGPDDAHRLVCGLCKAVLDGVHPTRSAADLAADEHARQAHPNRAGVVVLTVPEETADRWTEDVLEIAVRAQRGVREDETAGPPPPGLWCWRTPTTLRPTRSPYQPPVP